ncbi:DUF397 domain-containing protein [Micromonospora sp. WMMD737]|uniref:DUF397 domain-containing protein n=1 Tax=Micromonospora sp. WMMD737 TaxID=3404113 RepID=UPI003B9268D7
MSDASEGLTWRKSSESLNGDCVEVASLPDGVAVRDSKNPGGPRLTFSRSEWHAFLQGANQGEFNDL